MCQAEREGGVRAARAGRQDDTVVAVRLVLLQHAEVGQRHLPRVIGLAGNDLQLVGFRVHRLADDLVDIGQLLVGRIHRIVVGVAVPDANGRRLRIPHPRVHGRLVEVGAGIEPEVMVEGLAPTVEPLFLRKLVGIRVVLDVPLLQVRARCVRHPVAAAPVQKVQDHARVRRIVIPAHRVVVDHGHVIELYGGSPGVDFLVRVDVVEHEREVLGDEGIAVGPLHPFPQVERKALLVIGEFVVQRQVRFYRAVEVHAQRVRTALRRVGHVLPGVGPVREHVERAAVGSHRLQGFEHLRLNRQALLDRRQFARRNHRRQHRCFLVVGRGGHHGPCEQHRRGTNQGYSFHHISFAPNRSTRRTTAQPRDSVRSVRRAGGGPRRPAHSTPARSPSRRRDASSAHRARAGGPWREQAGSGVSTVTSSSRVNRRPLPANGPRAVPVPASRLDHSRRFATDRNVGRAAPRPCDRHTPGHDLARIVQTLRRRERESDRLLLNPGPNPLNRERPETETPTGIAPDAKRAG